MSEQASRTLPKIRFRGFETEWEESSVGEVLAEKKRPVVLRDYQRYELITVKRRNEGVVSRGHFWGWEILVKNYSQLKAGDFVISKRQVVHGATGLIPEKLDEAIVSNEYLVAVSSSKLLMQFLAILASQPDMRQKFFLSSYGVDIEKLFFDVEDWKGRRVTIPGITEQARISEYFRELDSLIGLHQRKHENLVMLRKSMLQKLFPQAGAAAPEIRFKGFSSPWNSEVMSKIGQPYTGLAGKTKADFGHGLGRYVTYMSVFGNAISSLCMTGSTPVDHRQNEVKRGDVLFTISSETPNEVGMSSVWMDEAKDVYLNSFCFGFRPSSKFCSEFLAYLFRAHDFRRKVALLAQGISRYNISKARVMDISVSIPEYEEQRKIGAYFCALDKLISQHVIQLQKLHQIKSACLEKMFV